MRRAPGTVAAALAVSIALLVGACTASGSSSSSAGSAVKADVAAGAAGAPGVNAAAAPSTTRQIITTASAHLRVGDVSHTLARISDLVADAGGRTQERSQDDPAGSAKGGGTAHMVVRVPATALTRTLDSLAALGTVTQVSVNTRDVTTTAVDLDARISALQASTARLQHLLQTAATTADLVAAESALTDRQAQLESLQAQRVALAGQVELSTLTLTIVSRDAPVAGVGFSGGLSNGWHALGAAAAVMLVVLGTLLPWLVVAGAIVAAVLTVRRGRRSRQLRRGASSA